MPHDHAYATRLAWSGSTADGYRAYDRTHRLAVAGTTLDASADPAFRGDADLPNPEQLLLAAASSCQLLSFLALAARDGLEVTAYDDDAEALMPGDAVPLRVTRIVLRPRIVTGADPARVEALCREAHEQCYVANTLTAEVVVEPTVVAP